MASTTLNKTFSANATNGNKFTFSCWVKRGKLGTRQQIFSAYDGGAGGQDLEFEASTDVLSYNGGGSGDNDTNMVFRDTSAWYHIVLAQDTTQGSASTQVKIYVNGVQQSLGVNNGASVVSQFGKNGETARIGSNYNGTNYYFDGSISHVHFIDGTAYDASTFGSTDSTTGEWKINTSPSVTYGNNGFFILKDGNSVTDQSGNSNNFTVGGGTLTKTEDCPSNVFATWNPLARFNGNFNFSNGNTSVSAPSGTWNGSIATMGFNSGKWYWEAKFSGNADNQYIGVFDESANPATNNPMNRTGTTAFYNYNGGEMIKDGSFTTADYGTITSSQICGVAVDADNNTISIYRDGVAIVSNYALSTTKNLLFPFISVYATTADYNFGNGYFGTTAVATNSGNGYAGAEGSSIFNYQPPTGYSALSTKGLNL